VKSRSLFFLQNAFESVKDFLEFDPMKAYVWNTSSSEDKKSSAVSDAKEARVRANQRKGKMPRGQFETVMASITKKIPALQKRAAAAAAGDQSPASAGSATPQQPGRGGGSSGASSMATGSMMPPPAKRTKTE
jgi:hypothetical protein